MVIGRVGVTPTVGRGYGLGHRPQAACVRDGTGRQDAGPPTIAGIPVGRIDCWVKLNLTAAIGRVDTVVTIHRSLSHYPETA